MYIYIYIYTYVYILLGWLETRLAQITLNYLKVALSFCALCRRQGDVLARRRCLWLPLWGNYIIIIIIIVIYNHYYHYHYHYRLPRESLPSYHLP